MPQRTNLQQEQEQDRIMPVDSSLLSAASPSHTSSSDDTTNKDGIIIIQNNQFFITSPLPGGKPAVVSSIAPVVLKKNRQKITGQTEVLSSDRLEWEIEEPAPYDITVSQDRLTAYLTLRRVENFAWRLKNCPATNQIAVRAEQDKNAMLSTLRIEQILADFDKRSISHNLNIPAIYEEMKHPSGRPIRVAEGTPPKPATAAKLEMVFAPDELAAALFHSEEDTDGEYAAIPSVKRGDIIAVKHPFAEGVPGYDVYGRLLPAEAPEDIYIAAKEQTREAGGNIIALSAGRPRVTGIGLKTFDIPAAHIVEGCVNADTGHILFSGDVAVHGDVEEDMIIEAIGNVYIFGSVRRASIAATGSIFVRGSVIDSQLYSGYYGVLNNRLYSLSKQIMEEGNLLRQAAKVLAKKLDSRKQPAKYGQVIQLLLDTKYKRFAVLIPRLLNVLTEIKQTYHQDTKQLKRLLEVFQQPDQFIGFLSDAVVESFLKLLKELSSGIMVMQETKVRIDVPYSEGSLIQSGGNIHIFRQGLSDSRLFAAGDIAFTASDSLCENGSLEAEGTITAATVESSDEAKSVLKAGKRLILRKMTGGTITVGSFTEEVAETLEYAVITPQTLQRRQLTT